ncbi:MAG: long-chain-fatty-acid--CoA ligase [Ottowia sp.]|uniref:long-chain-fatty-acid--CoA ligase n=1 Tax=Ottowia sp. TaxID=1898956 RepID=UPI003C710EED
MQGLMQDWPLLCQRIIEHAARQHPKRRIVTRTVEGPIEVTNYAELHSLSLRISKKLNQDGVTLGDRVGTLAWSTARHLACWYGIAGLGAIYHPVNPRLFPEQIAYIINDAKDRVMLVDTSFVSLLESIADKLTTVERFVVLTDRAHMPDTSLKGAVSFEEWLEGVDDQFQWPTFDENTAVTLTYTSGTTGNPKGVLYSHRSVNLMSLTGIAPDMYAFSSHDIVLQVIPMSHANGWSWPFSAPMTGAGLVFPGAQLDGASLVELIESEGVTMSGGVPTVWQSILSYLAGKGQRLTKLKRVYIGGSAGSRALLEEFRDRHGVEVRSGFGMTEMGPMSGVGSLMPETAALPPEQEIAIRQTQGRPPYLVEYRLIDDQGQAQPWDGESPGHLRARGPCIAQAYYGQAPGSALDEDGFFDSGDIATIDVNGYVHLTDRAKDLVKSGGEWISSIDLENHAMGFPGIHEAAVVGVRHPKWDERPLMLVVPKPGASVEKQAMLKFLSARVARWWLPDDVVEVTDIPHTATGKINKAALRRTFAAHYSPADDKS